MTSLSVGDYVTHIDHGIGKFGGLQKIQVEGKTQEAIKLVYADNDIVYVSIHVITSYSIHYTKLYELFAINTAKRLLISSSFVDLKK